MDEKEKLFHKKADKALLDLENKYRSKFKLENPFLNGPHNSMVHSDLLNETRNIIADIANEVFEKGDETIALKVSREKSRSFLPRINKLRGL